MTRPLIDEVWTPVANINRFIVANWIPNHAYTVGKIAYPTISNGHKYKVTTSGTTAGTEPAWPTGTSSTVVDGTVTWTENGTDVKTADDIYTHNALVWNGKLWIFCGQGAGGQSHLVNIISYNLTTGAITEEYLSIIGIVSANCIWRDGVVFNNNLYAALTGQTSGPTNRGSVWKWNSVGSMTEVLNTNTVDPPGLRGIYKLCEFNGYLYAGGGEDNVLATLYRSATGAAGTWSICATFSGYNWVRGLVVWNNELWVGTKGNASLWHGDGTTFTKVSNWPVEAVFQAKELIPFNNKLYIGCVNTEAYSAKIYSYNGTTFTTELNFPTDHEIFHGDVANNCLYFSVRTSDTNGTGGAVVVKDSLGWREVFRDTGLEFNHIHWVKSGGNGRLYMSGSNLEGKDAVLYSAIINRTLRS